MHFRRSSYWPYKPELTEHNLPDQSGKVFIITGASSGIGRELVDILYLRNARIYLAARSKDKTMAVIQEIEKAHPDSKGEMYFLKLQLDDLTTIKQSASEFLTKETRLDVLWLNAGVMVPPQGAKTVQGYDLQLGTNNLGHFLFTHLLTPLIKATAKAAPKDSVRVVWVSSSTADNSPVPAIDFSNMDYHNEESTWTKYFRSKAGTVLHSVEFIRRHKDSGIISLSLNPGNFSTGLQKDVPRPMALFHKLISSPVRNGAYTELFAGLDPSITASDNGAWVSPFGKTESPREDLLDADLGRKYWNWTEEQVRQYL